MMISEREVERRHVRAPGVVAVRVLWVITSSTSDARILLGYFVMAKYEMVGEQAITRFDTTAQGRCDGWFERYARC